MGNMRIGTRLLLGFGTVVILTIVLGLYSIQSLQTLQQLTNEMDTRDLLTFQSIQSINSAEEQMRGLRRAVLLAAYLSRDRQPSDSPDSLSRQWDQAREENQRALTQLEQNAEKWEGAAVTPQRAVAWRKIRTTLAEARRALAAITPEAARMFSSINMGNLTAGAVGLRETERLGAEYQTRLTEARNAAMDQIELGRTQLSELANETRMSVLFALILTAGASFIISLAIHRSITQPLTEFTALVERVGKGDLRHQFETTRRDEIGDLGRSLNRMVSGLKELAAQIKSVAESLNAATAEILASTQQHVAGTAEQAAAVQQANATMAEISQSGAQISDRARQVAAAAEAASNASATGMHSVRNTASIMESIREQAEAVAENVVLLSEKTQAVGEIIQSVNDIAEQSHLLSLNASIQAAVAGEHGKSFSVVANEMKNLASQSKQATVQVRSILGDIQKGITRSVMLTEEAVKRVESGRQQSTVAESTIRELTSSIEESIRAFQQIVGGSSQQQIGFDQVAQAFRNIGIASQETAASTKQSEKAVANLSALTQQLRTAVEQYRI